MLKIEQRNLRLYFICGLILKQNLLRPIVLFMTVVLIHHALCIIELVIVLFQFRTHITYQRINE